MNPETTTCVFAHPKMQGLYYCKDHPQGMTQDINTATKFMGAVSRSRGLKELRERFPKIKDGQVIFFYLNSMDQQ